MKLIAKLSSLIRAVARGPSPRPGKPSVDPQDGPPVDDAAVRRDTARLDEARDAAAVEDPGQTLENERVADLLQRRQGPASAERGEQGKGGRR